MGRREGGGCRPHQVPGPREWRPGVEGRAGHLGPLGVPLLDHPHDDPGLDGVPRLGRRGRLAPRRGLDLRRRTSNRKKWPSDGGQVLGTRRRRTDGRKWERWKSGGEVGGKHASQCKVGRGQMAWGGASIRVLLGSKKGAKSSCRRRKSRRSRNEKSRRRKSRSRRRRRKRKRRMKRRRRRRRRK